MLATRCSSRRLLQNAARVAQIQQPKIPSSALMRSTSHGGCLQQQQQRRTLSTRKDAQMEAEERADAQMEMPSGLEAVQALPMEIKLSNYATAAVLVAFVSGVYYYSMQAIAGSGKPIKDQFTGKATDEDTLAALRMEANDALMAKEQKKSASELQAQELAQLDMGLSDKDDLGDDLIVAVAAPDAIAQVEEDKNRAAMKSKGGGSDGKRPLW
eukprot:CAMPEP_0194054842 /NCGR_PEP_ID=MMETSP0009_2-20130614/54721_1 /TAXON_ID=210454 /ORGANISM="Grammatophora oceanica, Strain CCMP 410" /LENGTH=212 /DNA_ID=CAMNT_0038703505 /DNA_START=74 /DNA_END=709 /DNA_ORIENTATION=-